MKGNSKLEKLTKMVGDPIQALLLFKLPDYSKWGLVNTNWDFSVSWGVSASWGKSKRMSTFLLLSEEIWIQELASMLWCSNLLGGKNQHTPPSIYLILKIIFHWVWLASARAVTHTGIQTKAALAQGQWAGAGWSMSVLSSEQLLHCFQTCFGLGRWCIHLFIRNVLTGNANSLHLGRIALETAGGTQQKWLGWRLLLLALEADLGLL